MYTKDDADVTLMILSMFTVAKAILEVHTVMQELNVIRSTLLLLCLELQQWSWHPKVKDLGISFFSDFREIMCSVENSSFSVCGRCGLR